MLKLVLLFLSLAVSLVIAEGIVRLFGLAPAMTSTPWSSNVRVVEDPEYRYYVHTNSLGLRDSREFPRDSPSTRVLFIGDSFTFGNGVSNEDTISFKTESILNHETSRSWTVINAGVPGTGTRAEERQLQRVLARINVNAFVLFYFVDNDPYETQQEYESESHPGHGPGSDSASVRMRAALGRYSALYRFLRLRLATEGTLRAFPYTIFDQCDPAKVKTFERMDALMRASVDGMKQIAREKKLTFLAVLIPRREQVSTAAFDKFKQSYRVSRYPYDRLLPQKRILEDVFGPEGISTFDLMSVFEDTNPDKYYYRFDGHFNPEGTTLVAQQLAKLLQNAMPSGKEERRH